MIKDFLLKPYSLLGTRVFKWLFCFTGPVLGFIYILTVKPYGFGWFDPDEQVRLALYYSVPAIGIWAVHLFGVLPLILKKLNVLNTLLLLGWIHFVTSLYVYSFSEVYIFDSQFDWYFFPETLGIVFRIGGLVTLLFVVIHFGYLIKQRRSAKGRI